MDPLLLDGKIVKNTYEIDRLIGSGAFGEVYRVKHKFLGNQALKVLKPDVLKESEQNIFVDEATILSNITHPNVVRVYDANYFRFNREKLYYISMEFVSGETLIRLLKRKTKLNLDVALSFQKDICAGLSIAHQQNPPVIHRDIKPQNILLSYDTSIPTAKISDFGVAKAVDPDMFITDSAGTILFMSPEGFMGIQNTRSDVFSSGLIFYQMITGIPPWLIEFDESTNKNSESMKSAVIRARKKEPSKPSLLNEKVDAKLDEIIMTAISIDEKSRFSDSKEMLDALLSYSSMDKLVKNKKPSKNIEKVKKNNGFQDVAGMKDLKDMVYSEIILPLKERETYEKYKIPPPNGILLYGPPGCGKTYFARKLGEELGHKFFEVKPSDLASTYIHGSQKKIGDLFSDARKSAPSIIFIDEIDAVLPKRSDKLDHHFSSEVNELLAQIGDCAIDDILVLGATNRLDQIDNAALRTGRFDKKLYIPPPDNEARVALLEMYLKDRPVSDDVKLDLIATATNGYSASDMKEITNVSARIAMKNNTDINFKILIDSINIVKSSVNEEDLEIKGGN